MEYSLLHRWVVLADRGRSRRLGAPSRWPPSPLARRSRLHLAHRRSFAPTRPTAHDIDAHERRWPSDGRGRGSSPARHDKSLPNPARFTFARRGFLILTLLWGHLRELPCILFEAPQGFSGRMSAAQAPKLCRSPGRARDGLSRLWSSRNLTRCAVPELTLTDGARLPCT